MEALTTLNRPDDRGGGRLLYLFGRVVPAVAYGLSADAVRSAASGLHMPSSPDADGTFSVRPFGNGLRGAVCPNPQVSKLESQ
jgi:hypothetical protein